MRTSFITCQNFKIDRNVMLGMIRNGMLDGFVENYAEYKIITATSTVEQDRLKKELLLIFMAVLFLPKLDQNQFCDMLLDYWNSYANKES